MPGLTTPGVVIVEHMAKKPEYAELLEKRRDVRWRSLSLEKRKDENQVEPSTESRSAVMSLLIKNPRRDRAEGDRRRAEPDGREGTPDHASTTFATTASTTSRKP